MRPGVIRQAAGLHPVQPEIEHRRDHMGFDPIRNLPRVAQAQRIGPEHMRLRPARAHTGNPKERDRGHRCRRARDLEPQMVAPERGEIPIERECICIGPLRIDLGGIARAHGLAEMQDQGIRPALICELIGQYGFSSMSRHIPRMRFSAQAS